MTALDAVLHLQSGVISRRQALDLGSRSHDFERMLRRHEWVRLLPGVFVDHTGAPSWEQRAWAGVLHFWPAALTHGSALRAHLGVVGREDDAPIQVAVDRDRHVASIPGYRLRRVAHLERRVRWNLAPPRLGLEAAALDVAAEAATDFAAFEVLAELCRSRRTTPRRLADAVRSRARLRGRRRLLTMLADLEAGTCSVLERGYHTQVEGPHGLPRPKRQRAVRSRTGSRYRDVDYPAYGLVVELDGRMFHDSPGDRDRDLERDLDSAVEGRTTVRLGWGQVFDRSCHTAARVGAVLQHLGWEGCARAVRAWVPDPARVRDDLTLGAVEPTYLARRIHRADVAYCFVPALSARSTRARPSSTAFA